jgi:NADH-quinone oxidoreductase E subunit
MDRTEILERFEPGQENLLMILHDLQGNNPGQYISSDDIRAVADYLNIPVSSVYGVITYYSMFSLRPRGKYIIRVCSSIVCEMTGSESLIELLGRALGISVGSTTGDGLFTLETSECLGRCDEAPGMIVNDVFYGNLTDERINEILNSLREKE